MNSGQEVASQLRYLTWRCGGYFAADILKSRFIWWSNRKVKSATVRPTFESDMSVKINPHFEPLLPQERALGLQSYGRKDRSQPPQHKDFNAFLLCWNRSPSRYSPEIFIPAFEGCPQIIWEPWTHSWCRRPAARRLDRARARHLHPWCRRQRRTTKWSKIRAGIIWRVSKGPVGECQRCGESRSMSIAVA